MVSEYCKPWLGFTTVKKWWSVHRIIIYRSTPTSHRAHIGKEEAGSRPRRSSIASRRRSVMKQSHRFRAPCVCWKYAMRKSPPELPYACQVQVRRIGESKAFCIYVLFKDGVQPKYCTKYAKLSREVYKVMCFAIFLTIVCSSGSS